MATRSRTQIFVRYRDSLRTHNRGPRTNLELADFKVQKGLMAAQSDDEGTIDHPLAYSIPPIWVTMVDDMNRDISKIKIKSALPLPALALHAHANACCSAPWPVSELIS